MPVGNNNNNNTEANNDNNQTSDSDESPYEINKEACEKYGITLRQPPTEPVEPISRYNYDDTVYGFVTEVTHDQKGTEVEIKDWGYCLENNRIELGFSNMKRSQIMEEVIKSYGLVPAVDLSGLPDDTISWDNQISSKSNIGGGGNLVSASGDGSMTEQECWEIAQSWNYDSECSSHDPEEAWETLGTTKGKAPDCYGATAWLYYVLNFKVGIPARDIVGKGYGSSGTHHCIQVYKNNEWVFPDEYDGMTTNLKVTSGMKSGDFKVSRAQPDSNGSIPEYRNDWYGNHG